MTVQACSPEVLVRQLMRLERSQAQSFPSPSPRQWRCFQILPQCEVLPPRLLTLAVKRAMERSRPNPQPRSRPHGNPRKGLQREKNLISWCKKMGPRDSVSCHGAWVHQRRQGPPRWVLQGERACVRAGFVCACVCVMAGWHVHVACRRGVFLSHGGRGEEGLGA